VIVKSLIQWPLAWVLGGAGMWRLAWEDWNRPLPPDGLPEPLPPLEPEEPPAETPAPPEGPDAAREMAGTARAATMAKPAVAASLRPECDHACLRAPAARPERETVNLAVRDIQDCSRSAWARA
jgi:hypothetical protein